MQTGRLQLVFFILFVLLVLSLNVAIFLPYASILFLALVFAIMFDPLYEWLRKTTRKETISALLSVFIVFLFIVGPVFLFGTILFQEALDLYSLFLEKEYTNSSYKDFLSAINAFIANLFPGVDVGALELNMAGYLEKSLSWVVDHTSVLFTGAFKVFVSLFLMLLMLFYFFKDGKKFVSSVVELSPLDDSYDKKIISRIFSSVNAVVRGHIVIGIIQGTLAGIGFAIFGVPSPVLFGTLAGLASFIPTIGTTLIILPAILFLFFLGSVGSALGLLIWGILAVGMVDNLLGPVLIQKGLKIHPLLILLSALGGLSLFGPIGFLAGPVCLSILFALLDIFPKVVDARHSSG